MKRKVKTKVKGFRTTDGAGVKLVRVLGNLTTKEFDPILMLDSFDSINPDDYTAVFPFLPDLKLPCFLLSSLHFEVRFY